MSGGGAAGAGGQGLFSPSLGVQRYETVRGIILEAAAAAATGQKPLVIVDLGESTGMYI